MKKSYFEVVNSGTPNVGEIKIYGLISDWYDEVSALEFLSAFNTLEAICNRINIHINSPGGSVWEGLPIANAIKSSKIEVHTYVDGIAFSMAGIIALATKKGNVHMAKGSLLMLHSASSYGYGNAESFKKQAEDLEKYDTVLAGFVEDRLGIPLTDVQASYFNGEDHYFTPTEALDAGLIDHVETYESEETPENVRNMKLGQVAAWFQGKEQIHVNNNNMFNNKFSKLSDLAKVAVNDRTVEQFEEINNQIANSGVEGVTLVSDSFLSDQEQEILDLNQKVEDLSADHGAKIHEKDQEINNLRAQITALENKPAGESGTPQSKGDDIPAGNGEGKKVEDEFQSPTDKWARKLIEENK